MAKNYLLSHSKQTDDNSVYYHSFVRPATQDELEREKYLRKTSPGSSILADSSKKTVFVDNPILTDVTQAPHTDIHTILNQNPDVSGLSLLLDDPARTDLRERVSIEDFIQPSQHVDIFDLEEFISNAKRSFNLLPASFRKLYNNNPMELVKAFDKNEPKALSLLQEYLGIEQELQSAGASGASSGAPKPSTTDDGATSESGSSSSTKDS